MLYAVVLQVVKLQAGIEYGKEDFVSAEVWKNWCCKVIFCFALDSMLDRGF